MLTHPGRVRSGNEDTCASDPITGSFVVCDGMGGAAAGEIASHLASTTFLAHLLPPLKDVPPPRADARLTAAIDAANDAVYQHSRKSPGLAGMGTTLVGLLYAPILKTQPTPAAQPASPPVTSAPITKIQSLHPHAHSRASDPPTLWLAHVGDSRCYRRRRGKLTLLTQDHSLVEEQLRAGQITAEEAARSPMRNLITRAVGSQSTVQPDIQCFRPFANDLYLLASDGLTRELSDEQIADLLAAIPIAPTVDALNLACESLINAANEGGGRDNITVLLVSFTPS